MGDSIIIKDWTPLSMSKIAPEELLQELRALHRDLAPNLGGAPSSDAVGRARDRAHAMIMRWGRGEFFT